MKETSQGGGVGYFTPGEFADFRKAGKVTIVSSELV